jgi:hypothetical protein
MAVSAAITYFVRPGQTLSEGQRYWTKVVGEIFLNNQGCAPIDKMSSIT